MNDHQRRVLNHMLASLKSGDWSEGKLRNVQSDLEANLGVLEDPQVISQVEVVIASLDECIHLLDEKDGVETGRKLCESLIGKIEARILA